MIPLCCLINGWKLAGSVGVECTCDFVICQDCRDKAGEEVGIFNGINGLGNWHWRHNPNCPRAASYLANGRRVGGIDQIL